MALGIVAAGTGSPVSIASHTVGGIIKTDVNPSGTYSFAFTTDGFPGITPQSGGGFVIAGTSGNAGIQISTTAGTVNLRADTIAINRLNDVRVALSIALAAGSSGAELVMQDSLGATVWEMDADGSELLAGSLGINGIAPPGFPVLATGASHTVDDVISLLQSYGFCKQS